tara:strand:+ start:1599 stop:2471 length:873 start_codon:yes stop_codon:yes gene_type:complete
MPELPEVEVVKRSLENDILKFSVKDIEIKDANLRYKVKRKDIIKIIGLKILSIKRRSKYLIFYFTHEVVMIAHLGMTGKFIIENKKNIKKKTSFYYKLDNTTDAKHDRIVFHFINGIKLIYNDVRKFGFIKFDSLNKLKNNSHLKILGPEPLKNLFNFQYFKSYIKGKKRIIKDLLMDQKFVSGLGNIYVNEILFYSRVKPDKKINKLLDLEIKNILINTKKILKKAIIYGGSSIKNFSSSSGIFGSYQQHFAVYGRKGNICSNTDCKERIKKIVISNRASFFCPKCQKY